MNINLIKEAENMLGMCNACSVSAVTEDGYPRICILVPIQKVVIKEIYFLTGTSSK